MKYLFSFLLLAIISCMPTQTVTTQDVWKCHEEGNWKAETIEAHLNGTWTWQQVDCPMAQTSNQEEHAGLRLVLMPKESGHLMDAAGKKTPFSWRLKPSAQYFELETNPDILQAKGYILLCGKEVVFNYSYLDGCNHRYVKE